MEPSLTQLFAAARDGDRDAADRLFGHLYDELRVLARRQLRRGARGGTLQTTVLLHETYLKLQKNEGFDVKDRDHFFALAARVMRQVLVDHFRRGRAEKRGGEWVRVSLEDRDIPTEQRGEVLLALDAALERLARVEERLARVVEYRFFGGMTEVAIANVLGVTDRTVRNDWVKAKAWLGAELSGE